MKKFQSFLTPQIEAFITYRKASQNRNEFYDYILRRFDSYCAENYPTDSFLSQEMVDNWCKQRETECNNTCRTRSFAIINFVRYLRARGKTDVEPPVIPRKERQTYIPHAFTNAELINFFDACDNLPSEPKTFNIMLRKITVPVFFRLLYSSGIRTTEARLLRTVNVDLRHGILDIKYSKGNDQHFVALHDSMTELLRQYDDAIRNLCPNREFFFPARENKGHARQWVALNFKELWFKANNAPAIAYDLRHHYAVSNINNWIGFGFGFDDKLMYLGKSMGHRELESTKYYYSLVPGFADILEEQTCTDFDDIVPEVKHEKVW